MRITPLQLFQVAAAGCLLSALVVFACHRNDNATQAQYHAVDGNIGYANKRGEFAIKPQFNGAARFSEGVAAVLDHGCLRFIRKDGTPAFEKRFFIALSPSHNEWVWTRTMDAAAAGCQFSGGLCPVPVLTPLSSQARWGYIDHRGEFVIEPQFQLAGPFWQGRALVRTASGDQTFINSKGSPIPGYSSAAHFPYVSELFGSHAAEPPGTLELMVHNGIYGYGNAGTGQFAIKPTWEVARQFSEGLASVRAMDGHEPGWTYGFIDRKGNFAFRECFTDAGYFSDGLAPVKLGSKWGYINRQGKVVIPFQFESACEFHEGLGCIRQNGLYGAIDKTGKMVIQPKFTIHLHFSDGMASTAVNPNCSWCRDMVD